MTWKDHYDRTTTTGDCWEPAIEPGTIQIHRAVPSQAGSLTEPGEVMHVCRSVDELVHVLDGVPTAGIWVTARVQDGEYEHATGDRIKKLVDQLREYESWFRPSKCGAA